MKIVVFSDIHYAPNLLKGPKAKRKLSQFSLPIIEKLINDINNNIKPNAVISLGDLIEDVKDETQDIENLHHIWNVLKEINPPFYSAIGNTEARSIKKDKIKKIMGYNNNTFSVDINGYHLVVLGINAKHSSDGTYQIYFSNEDLIWLKDDLEENKFPCLIFTHYGIAEDNMVDNWWYKKNPRSAVLDQRDEIKKLIKNNDNILAVFSGHQHWTKKLKEDGIDYYVIGSLTENINDDGIPDGIYFEVDVKDRDLKVNEHHIRL